MLHAEKRPCGQILSWTCGPSCLEFSTDSGFLRIEVKRSGLFRVRMSPSAFTVRMGSGILDVEGCPDFSCREKAGAIYLETSRALLMISLKDSTVSWHRSDGTLLFRETGRTMEAFEAPMPSDARTEDMLETVQTADGEKQVLRHTGMTRTLYHTRLNLAFQEEEYLYGLGQGEEGVLNLRGTVKYLHQANRKISIPLLVSSRAYGILSAADGAGIFRDDAFGSCLYMEAEPEMDYYVIIGEDLDGVISGYRYITGKASLLPRWALGYFQSQERYETEDELLSVAKEYRKRHIGMDCIVQDWCTWPENEWGQKSLDPERYGHMPETLQKLHDMHVRFMISIWPNMAKNCSDWYAFEEKNLLLPESDLYDAFDKRARDLYWKQTETALFSCGTDAWWCDSCEPFTPEWSHREKPDPACMYREYVELASRHIPMDRINAYALYHARTLWDGQRSACPEKRVVNLMRSAHTGQQQYGAILWSGDIEASWACLKRQIREGLSLCVSGFPYWTLDIGAFFVRRGSNWFWDGQYEQGMADPAYRELFVRWYQFGAFLPVFRGHGTDTRRELWQLDDPSHAFYDAAVSANRLRYLLLPYLYSLMGAVHFHDRTMMRLLAFDFPDDPRALRTEDEYMLGSSLLVCPVTDPGQNGSAERHIYFPGDAPWYDLFDGTMYEGGQETILDVPLNRIPVFARAGSILPVCPGLEHADYAPEQVEFCIFPGRDGQIDFYEDTGDGYAYEQGAYRFTRIAWDDKTGRLLFGDRIPDSKSDPAVHLLREGRGLVSFYNL